MDDPFIYGLLIVLFIFFSILKSAFNFYNQLQLELDKKKESSHFKILNFISKQISEFKLAVFIYYVILLVLIILKLESEIINYLPNHNHLIVSFVFVLFFSIFILPGIEILPSLIGEYFPNRIINVFSIPLITFYIILYPITKLLVTIINISVKIIFKDRFSESYKTNFNIEDLNKLVLDSQRYSSDKNHSESEIKLFQNALEFSEVKIRDCMIPRTEIVSVEIDDIVNELKNKFISTGLSRIIIYRDTIDNIIGYIKSYSLLSNGELENHIKSLAIFPETMPASKLLRYFIRTGQSMSIVVDEFGGTSGIISIEDILEEIFGEIKDEHDQDDLIEKKLSDKDYIFSGRLEIDYINDNFDLQIPEDEEYDTLAGFILYHTESIPSINQRIEIENFTFTILKVSNTRVELVKMEVIENQL